MSEIFQKTNEKFDNQQPTAQNMSQDTFVSLSTYCMKTYRLKQMIAIVAWDEFEKLSFISDFLTLIITIIFANP